MKNKNKNKSKSCKELQTELETLLRKYNQQHTIKLYLPKGVVYIHE